MYMFFQVKLQKIPTSILLCTHCQLNSDGFQHVMYSYGRYARTISYLHCALHINNVKNVIDKHDRKTPPTGFTATQVKRKLKESQTTVIKCILIKLKICKAFTLLY